MSDERNWMFDPSLSDDEFEQKLNEHFEKLENNDKKAKEEQKKIERLIDKDALSDVNDDLLKFANDMAAKYIGKEVDEDLTKNVSDDIVKMFDTIDKKLEMLEKELDEYDAKLKINKEKTSECSKLNLACKDMSKNRPRTSVFKNDKVTFKLVDSRHAPIPFLGGRPCRNDSRINDDDLLNLKIALETSKSFDGFLSLV